VKILGLGVMKCPHLETPQTERVERHVDSFIVFCKRMNVNRKIAFKFAVTTVMLEYY